MQLLNGDCISREVSDSLFAELKSWTVKEGDELCAMDAFRYEQFARRIIAAEYGRPDAVTWAVDWYSELQERALEKQAMLDTAAAERAAEISKSRAELASGRAGNPLYQAYLDTLESISTVDESAIGRLNAGYFAFHSRRTAEYEQTDKQVSFAQYVRDYADQHLSERTKSRLKFLH